MTENETNIYPKEELTPEELEELKEFEDITDIEEALYETTWQEEAEQIPLEALEHEDQLILLKFKQRQTLTPEEYDRLAEILQQYRPAIQEIKPKEKLENYENNKEYLQAEKGFLDILKKQSQQKTLTVNYPLDDGTTYTIKLIIQNADSQTITDLQTNFKLFDDLTQQENNVRLKQSQGQKLSREEQIIFNNVQKKINQKTSSQEEEMILSFLSQYTRIDGEADSDEYMYEIYSSMDSVIRVQIFDRVAKMSGLVNPEIDDLFQ